MTRFGYRFVKLTSFSVFAGVICFLTLVSPATAGEEQYSGRYIDQKADANWVKVGDMEGHVVGSFHKQGIIYFDNDEVATRSVAGSFDSTKGVGPHEGYTITTYKDGSTHLTNWSGITKYTEDKVRVHEGTYTCVRGTGRFKGVKCEGTYTVEDQKNGMQVGHAKGTRTLPN